MRRGLNDFGMNNILLDSSILVDFLRLKDKKSTLFYKLVSQNYQLHISLITHSELYAGKSVWEKKTAKDELEFLLSEMRIINLDEALSKKAGEIKAKYGITLMDAIIAATAIVQKIKLATLNTRDFKRIKDLKIYKS